MRLHRLPVRKAAFTLDRLRMDAHAIKLGHIFLLSLLAILWWRCMWAILDEVYETLSKGRRDLLRILNVATIAIVVGILYYSPEILENL